MHFQVIRIYLLTAILVLTGCSSATQLVGSGAEGALIMNRADITTFDKRRFRLNNCRVENGKLRGEVRLDNRSSGIIREIPIEEVKSISIPRTDTSVKSVFWSGAALGFLGLIMAARIR